MMTDDDLVKMIEYANDFTKTQSEVLGHQEEEVLVVQFIRKESYFTKIHISR